MITTKDFITTVNFGDKKAKIAVISPAGSYKLIFQNIKDDRTIEIGSKLEEEHSIPNDLPKIEMDFPDSRSIDIVIGALELIKERHKHAKYHFSQAC